MIHSKYLAVALVFCAFGSASADTTTFIDDFEDAAATESEWQQTTAETDLNAPINVDALWNVVDDGTGNGVFQGDASQSARVVPIGANRLGCSSLDGFSIYRNTTQTMVFDMRLESSPPGARAQAGNYVVGDVTHPSLLPVAGLFLTYEPLDGGTYFGVFQQDDFEGAAANIRGIEVFLPYPAFDPFQMHQFTLELADNAIDGYIHDSASAEIVSVNFPLSPMVESPFLDIQQGGSGFWVQTGSIAYFDNVLLEGDEVCLDNTEAGTNVETELIQGITATFDEVTTGGSTTVVRSDDPPLGAPTSTAFEFFGEFFDVTTTAEFVGDVTLCFPYDDTGMTQADEENLRLLHFDETLGVWEDITLSPNDTANNIVCGVTDGFSVFTLGLPELTATVGEPLGNETSSAAPAGPYKQKRTIPIKFQLRNADAQLVSDAQAQALDVTLDVYYDQPGAGGTPVDPGDNPPDLGDSFRYDADADQFIFNLGTKHAGWLPDYSYRVVILVSGSPIEEVYFSLK